jgi:hypothetical protein
MMNKPFANATMTKDVVARRIRWRPRHALSWYNVLYTNATLLTVFGIVSAVVRMDTTPGIDGPVLTGTSRLNFFFQVTKNAVFVVIVLVVIVIGRVCDNDAPVTALFMTQSILWKEETKMVRFARAS